MAANGNPFPIYGVERWHLQMNEKPERAPERHNHGPSLITDPPHPQHRKMKPEAVEIVATRARSLTSQNDMG